MLWVVENSGVIFLTTHGFTPLKEVDMQNEC